MDKSKLKERRSAIRINVVSGESWLNDPNWSLLDVSNSGAFLQTEDVPTAQTKNDIQAVSIKLPNDLGLLILPCEVVRIQWRETKDKKKGFAVKFNITSPQIETVFSSWLTFLRNHQIMTVSKRIIEDFFGVGKGPKIQ